MGCSLVYSVRAVWVSTLLSWLTGSVKFVVFVLVVVVCCCSSSNSGSSTSFAMKNIVIGI